MKITLLGLNHEVQWNDSTGDLHRILGELIASSQIDLIAEEAFGLPATVGQHLACKFDKPWLEIDMETAERIQAGIYEELQKRIPIPHGVPSRGHRRDYLPREDGIREAEWVKRIAESRVNSVLCLCGVLHLAPFKRKLEDQGFTVEVKDLTKEKWFVGSYGKHTIIEQQNGTRFIVTP